MITDIFLDCDGVLFDFTNAALKVHGVGAKERDKLVRSEYRIEKQLGMTAAEFWKPLDTTQFWTSVGAYAGAAHFIAGLLAHLNVRSRRTGWNGSVSFCTMSSEDLPAFTYARHHAIRKLLKEVDVIYTVADIHKFPIYIGYHGTKYVFGGKGRLLVDDYPRNCSEFERAGGTSILVPMPWNTKSLKASYSGPDYGKLLRKIKKEIGR